MIMVIPEPNSVFFYIFDKRVFGFVRIKLIGFFLLFQYFNYDNV